MNSSCIYVFTFCRKCKKLRDCLETDSVSRYRFLCKHCLREEGLSGECRSCGREGIESLLRKHGGYCHLCINDNIVECDLCGSEVYSHNINNGICNKCESGKNKPCIKCGDYVKSSKLTSDDLCEKCAIAIYKTIKKSKVNEVVECLECGREAYVYDLHEGLCIYCYSQELECKINRLNRRVKRKSY